MNLTNDMIVKFDNQGRLITSPHTWHLLLLRVRHITVIAPTAADAITICRVRNPHEDVTDIAHESDSETFMLWPKYQ